MMRGWTIRAYRERIVLMDDLSVPTAGPHDILIQIRSAEVGDWDELVRTQDGRPAGSDIGAAP